MYIYQIYKTLENIVNQAYNYDIYKNEFTSSQLLNIFISKFANYSNENGLIFLDIIYKNPNIINFFYYNPDLMKFFMENDTYFCDFININEILNPMTDIYQFVYNSGSNYADFLNPNPIPVNDFSCIGLDFKLDSLLNQNSILQSLINQNYNNNIYYLSLYNNENLVTLLSNNIYFDKLSSIIESNPNILNFFSQNDRLIIALLENPDLIDDLILIPNINDPKYDLYILFYQNEEFKDFIDYPSSFDPLQLCDIFITPTICGNANVIIDVLSGNLSTTGNLFIENISFGNLNISGNIVGSNVANIVEFKDISVSNDNFTNSSNPSEITNPLATLQNIQSQINQGVYLNLYSKNIYSSATDGVCGKNSSIKIRSTAPFKQYVSGVRKIYIRTLNLLIPDLFRLSWSDPSTNSSVSRDNPFYEGTNTVIPYFYYKNSKPSGFENGVYNKQCLLSDINMKSLMYFGFTAITKCILMQNNPFQIDVTYANPTYVTTNTKIIIDNVMSPFHLINFMTQNIVQLNIPIQENNNSYKFDSFVSYFYKRYNPHSIFYQLVLLLQRMDLSYRNKSGGKTNCDYNVEWDFTISAYYDTEEIQSNYQKPALKQSEMVDIYLLYERIKGVQSLNYKLNINSVQLFYSAYTPDSYMDFLHILTLTRQVLRDVYLEFRYISEKKTRYIQPYMYPAQFETCKDIINRFLKNKMNMAIKH